MAVSMIRNGLASPGGSDSGEWPVQYPSSAFNAPPFTKYGLVIRTQPDTFAAWDKWAGPYVSTIRVEIFPNAYLRGGQWQPVRFPRNESWLGFAYGSSSQ
jgi:hypothetical protein